MTEMERKEGRKMRRRMRRRRRRREGRWKRMGKGRRIIRQRGKT